MLDIDLTFLPIGDGERSELKELFDELITEGGDNLESLVVFGSAASGDFDPALSDINLLVVLRRDDRDVLEAIKPALTALIRQFKVSPMITTGEELKSSADVFPVKFLYMREQHRVLFGADPFVAMTIRRVHLRLRCEQELKNIALKLRRALISRAATPTARQDMIRGFLPPFMTVLRTMLTMSGETPSGDRLGLLRQAATSFDLPKDELAALTNVSRGEASDLDDEELEALSHAFLKVVARAAAVADVMAEAADDEP